MFCVRTFKISRFPLKITIFVQNSDIIFKYFVLFFYTWIFCLRKVRTYATYKMLKCVQRKEKTSRYKTITSVREKNVVVMSCAYQ